MRTKLGWVMIGLVALAFGGNAIYNAHLDLARSGLEGVRDEFISINKHFRSLLGDRAEIVNVGNGANSGDGELLDLALAKINRNLDRVRNPRCMGDPDDQE